VKCLGISSTLTSRPLNTAVRQGSAVTLRCSSDVSGSVIQWYNSLCVTTTDSSGCTGDLIYNGFSIVNNFPSTYVVTPGNNATHVTRDLSITSTQLTDAGVHLCAEQVAGIGIQEYSSSQLIVLGNYYSSIIT